MSSKIDGKGAEPRMIEVNLDLTRPVFSLILLGLLAAVVIAYLAWGAQAVDASSPSAATYAGMRKYYLTTSAHGGAGPTAACASGYHMASLWEILDTTQLEYNTSLGFTMGDTGSGPPTYVYGWIRTGYFSSTSSTPGQGNCACWTNGMTGSGTIAQLPSSWSSTYVDLHVWDVATDGCGTTVHHVWCVEN
jgi:hypothetical protein